LKSLGILIVTYQSERYIKPLLESLAATIDPAQCAICVLDNASTDGTVPAIEREMKRLKLPMQLVKNMRNDGYARANNEAFTALQADDPCQHIVLLNPDVVVQAGWWQPLIAALKDPEVGTVAPLLLLPDGTVNSRGNGLHFLGFGFVQGYGEAASTLPERPRLFSGSGAAVAFRAKALEQVNARLGTTRIFWEDLFLYAEDTDLGWRFRLVGFDHRLVPASRVVHDHQFWIQPLDPSNERLFYIERNRYLLLLANFKLITMVLLLPWIVASEVALGLGFWKLYPRRLHLWRAIGKEACTGRFWQRRWQIQKGRRIGDGKILKAMTGSVRHGALPIRPADLYLETGLQWSHRFLSWVVLW
jgi:GT2 family glycosyltransferase